MSAHTSSGIILSDLGLAWPDGASAPRYPRGIPAEFIPERAAQWLRRVEAAQADRRRGQVDMLHALEGRNTSAGCFVALAERWDVETEPPTPFAKSGLGQPAPAPGWPKVVSAVEKAVIVAMRFTVLAVGSRELVIGSRARQHRHQLGRMPAPQHPRTAGRPRTRAPARSITVA